MSKKEKARDVYETTSWWQDGFAAEDSPLSVGCRLASTFSACSAGLGSCITAGPKMWPPITRPRQRQSADLTNLLLKKKTTPAMLPGACLIAQLVKNLPENAGDLGSITGLGGFTGGGNSYSLLCSGLENRMDTVHGVTKIGHDWATLTFTLLCYLPIGKNR